MESFYDVFGIDNTATDKEIKKAYAFLLRKYPPEKSPEDFQNINKVYETLIDSESRILYDKMLEYQEVITKLEIMVKDADDATENEDYKRAIKIYKSVLIVNKNLNDVRNKLGLALFYDKQYREAIVEFEIILEVDSNNATYHSNLAMVYREIKEVNLSEKHYFLAYKLDSKNTSMMIDVSKFHLENKEYSVAESFLIRCIEYHSVKHFQKTLYYLELLSVYLFTGNVSMFEKTLDDIESIIPSLKMQVDYVALEFAKLGSQLYDAGAFELSEDIGRRAYKINSDNKYIETTYKRSRDINIVFSLFEKLKKDTRVNELLKNPVYYYLQRYTNKTNKERNGLDQDIKDIVSYIEYDHWTILYSMEILSEEYEVLYNLEKLIYDNIYNLAKDRNEIVNNFYVNKPKEETSYTYNSKMPEEKSQGHAKTLILFALIIAGVIVMFLID